MTGRVYRHPYPPFLPEGVRTLIVGTIPPPRFSLGQLRARDVDFCYGSEDNLLWPILAKVYGTPLDYQPTAAAVDQRKQILAAHAVGICDTVESCYRQRPEASDLGMEEVRLRPLLQILAQHRGIDRLLLMGGGTAKGPEYYLRRQLREQGIRLACLRRVSPRWHRFQLAGRAIDSYSLISPSKAANRAIGATALYKEEKQRRPDYSPFDYRLEQYQRVLLEGQGISPPHCD